MLKKEDNTYIHKNKGVCSSAVTFEVEDNKLKNVNFIGGCSGNTAGIGTSGRRYGCSRCDAPSGRNQVWNTPNLLPGSALHRH